MGWSRRLPRQQNFIKKVKNMFPNNPDWRPYVYKEIPVWLMIWYSGYLFGVSNASFLAKKFVLLFQ